MVGVSVWALLREARARARFSQRALAARAGVAQSEIARIENGRQEPSFDRLEQLVCAAGFDLKIELVPHDDHDEKLIRLMLASPVEQRLDSLAKAVRVDDSIRIKRAIGGPKYLSHLPLLRELQRQRRDQGLD